LYRWGSCVWLGFWVVEGGWETDKKKSSARVYMTISYTMMGLGILMMGIFIDFLPNENSSFWAFLPLYLLSLIG
jgi:hypothetical protein